MEIVYDINKKDFSKFKGKEWKEYNLISKKFYYKEIT